MKKTLIYDIIKSNDFQEENMIDNRLKSALLSVQKPARYTGGEPGCIVKDKNNVDIRFAFCFPDTYEVGMSHLRLKVIYDAIDRKSVV